VGTSHPEAEGKADPEAEVIPAARVVTRQIHEVPSACESNLPGPQTSVNPQSVPASWSHLLPKLAFGYKSLP